MTEKIIMTELT